ncbi:MAG: hypothetical protein AB7O65_10930 [Candidatus Korobacteraceae bacterium]
MRKGIVTLLLVFAFAAYGVAWQAPGNPGYGNAGAGAQGADPSSQRSADDGKSVIGCLQASTGGDTWTLKTDDGKTVNVKPEDDVKDQFSKHVGHHLRLTGEWEEGEERTTAANRQPGADMPQGDQSMADNREFKAEKLDMVAETCPTSGIGSPQSQPGGQMNPGAPPEQRGPEAQPTTPTPVQ